MRSDEHRLVVAFVVACCREVYNIRDRLGDSMPGDNVGIIVNDSGL